MSNEAKKGSELGFYMFLILAGILLIPLAIGLKNFDQILRIGKILLITIGTLAAILLGVLSYIRIMRKMGKRNKIRIARKNNESLATEAKEEATVEIETTTENDELLLKLHMNLI
ncbi:MAG TPA: hypothetical protein VMZ29_09890 [Candidatus Bathyarchaeia archaeon]|nr:hypothetical protein [Candidatus Bathyarchaeia archaeon]